MTHLARAAGAMALLVLAACETTGNPREGGLFGWSEEKAKTRQSEKRSLVAEAEAELTRETTHGDALRNRQADAEQTLEAASVQRRRTLDQLRIQQARLRAKTEKLEAESPTAATASRARTYRLKLDTIAAQTSLSPQQRAERLHDLETEIDAALAR